MVVYVDFMVLKNVLVGPLTVAILMPKCIGGVFSVYLAAHGLFFSDSSTKQWRITVGNSGRGFLGSFDDVSSFSPYIDFMILGKCLLERYAGNAGKTSNALRDVFWV